MGASDQNVEAGTNLEFSYGEGSDDAGAISIPYRPAAAATPAASTAPVSEVRPGQRRARRFLAWRNPARPIRGTWMAGRLRANHLGR